MTGASERSIFGVMKIAVTGATGHVGANLVRTLVDAGHEVRALSHGGNRHGLDGVAVAWHEADVLDLPSLARAFDGCERVFHLAARISIVPGDEEAVHAVNVTGTHNVVEACLQTQVRRLVHFSSIHALSPTPHDVAIDETRALTSSPSMPPYDRSKAAAEREVQAGLARGLDAVIVNPTAILGPHDYGPSAMGRVLLDLYHRRLPALVDGGFDWVDVRDVVDGALAAADRAPRGERYLLSGAHRSVRELAALAQELTGVRAPRLVSPMWLARVGAPFATAVARVAGKQPLFTRHSLHALRNHQKVSHDKASRELGYTVRPLRDTLTAAYDWFRQAGALA
jgi:dihydroflavonol-4-reductase